jgi:serine/threonine-protein kinase
VLDFGLAKVASDRGEMNITFANAVAGTPLYLSPEAITHPERVDARADVYAIGAVGYFLLTGSPVFTGSALDEICLKHISAVPEPASTRCGRPVSEDLEALVLRCLAKSPTDRPRDAADVLSRLEACRLPGRWTPADAAEWWAERERERSVPAEALAAGG